MKSFSNFNPDTQKYQKPKQMKSFSNFNPDTVQYQKPKQTNNVRSSQRISRRPSREVIGVTSNQKYIPVVNPSRCEYDYTEEEDDQYYQEDMYEQDCQPPRHSYVTSSQIQPQSQNFYQQNRSDMQLMSQQKREPRTSQKQPRVSYVERVYVKPQYVREVSNRRQTQQHVPRSATPKSRRRRTQTMGQQDMQHLQDQVNKDYQYKLKNVSKQAQARLSKVSREANQKIVDVNEERQRALREVQKGYTKTQQKQSRWDNERMYESNDMNDSIYTVDLSFNTGPPPREQRGGGKYQTSSKIGRGSHRVRSARSAGRGDGRSKSRSASKPRFKPVEPLYLQEGRRSPRRKSPKRRSPKKDQDQYSQDTFDAIDDSRNWDWDDRVYEDIAHGIECEAENPKKMKDFYTEFTDIVKKNLRPTHKGEEVFIHDILFDMHFIGQEVDKTDGAKEILLRDKDGIPKQAFSSDKVRNLKEKFSLAIKNDLKMIQGKPIDDIVKNLFKILCEIMNMPLKNRGHNPLSDDLLQESLDTINFSLLDSDLIILNQLATLKGLTNRVSFSLSSEQGQDIHDKFKNLYNQRRQYLLGSKDSKKEYYSKRPHQELPKDFNIHELEENRDFRQSAYYNDKYGSSQTPQNNDRRDYDRRDQKASNTSYKEQLYYDDGCPVYRYNEKKQREDYNQKRTAQKWYPAQPQQQRNSNRHKVTQSYSGGGGAITNNYFKDSRVEQSSYVEEYTEEYTEEQDNQYSCDIDREEERYQFEQQKRNQRRRQSPKKIYVVEQNTAPQYNDDVVYRQYAQKKSVRAPAQGAYCQQGYYYNDY